MYECYNCGARSVSWDCDYTFRDAGRDEEGIIQVCHCDNCGAHIENWIKLDEEDKE